MRFKANSQELELEIEDACKIIAFADQQYCIQKPKKLPTSLLEESYFESSMTAPENNFVFNVYTSNNNSRRNSLSRDKSYSSSRSRSRSNSRPRHKYRDDSFNRSYRQRSYDR